MSEVTGHATSSRRKAGTKTMALAAAATLAACAAWTAAPAPARADFFWVEGFTGYSYANLTLIKSGGVAISQASVKDSGYTLGGAAGVKLSIVTLGLRAGTSQYSSFDINTAALDLGLHLGKVIKPYFRAGLGYSFLKIDLLPGTGGPRAKARGLLGDLGVGLDVGFKVVSVGAGIDVQFLNLNHSKRARDLGQVDTTGWGNPVGLQLHAHVHLTVHL
ncbi:MAG: hypothetical protein KC543_06875 [Myxococcales bacterium]|nr:hypothetical protein [Myxococcales bacterium]